MWINNTITKFKVMLSIYKQLSDSSNDAKKTKIMEKDKLKIENEIIGLICKLTPVNMSELSDVNTFKSRKKELVVARQLHMVFKNLALSETLDASGWTYRKDHATVIYAIKTMQNLVETDRKFREQYRPLFERMIQIDHTLSERLNLKYLYK